jgi:tetratricopeptide (TPR) repeat protein
VIAGLITGGLWHREFGVSTWALDASARLDDAAPDRRAAVLAFAASGAFQGGDFARSEELARAVLTDRAAAGAIALANAWISLSIARAHAGEFRAALEILDTALAELPEGVGNLFVVAGMHSAATYWALMDGDVDRAKAEAATTVELGRQVGNVSALASGLLTFGYAWWRDDPDAALAAIDEGTQLVRDGATDTNLAGALQASALIHASRGQTQQAVAVLREALRHEHDIGDRTTTASVLFCVVNVLGGSGYPEIAATCAGIVTAGPLAGIGFHVDPDGYERGRAGAEHDLGAAAYQSSIDRTTTMSFDDACMHVLGELDRILAEDLVD